MRMIGSVPSEVHALRFSDYLLTVEVDVHIEESSAGAWQVWVEHDDDLDKAKAELEQFLTRPDDARYGSAKSAAAKIRKEEEKAAERRRRNYTDVRTSTAISGIARYGTPVAMGLVAICVLIYLAGQIDDTVALQLRTWLLFDITRGNMFDDILGGQVWRLVTPMLLHGGLIHLLFNMMWLWRLGQVIESTKGSLFFAVLVLCLSAISCSVQAGWYEFLGTWGLFLGISGVVAGLFGYAWMKHKLQPYEQIHVSDQEVGMMIGWLVICSFGFVGPIANGAHWGGLLAGMAIGAFPWAIRKLRKRG